MFFSIKQKELKKYRKYVPWHGLKNVKEAIKLLVEIGESKSLQSFLLFFPHFWEFSMNFPINYFHNLCNLQCFSMNQFMHGWEMVERGGGAFFLYNLILFNLLLLLSGWCVRFSFLLLINKQSLFIGMSRRCWWRLKMFFLSFFSLQIIAK